MTVHEHAEWHAKQAEELLRDSEKINDRNPRSQSQAMRANAHASLALFYLHAER